jgi:hypothetical protein
MKVEISDALLVDVLCHLRRTGPATDPVVAIESSVDLALRIFCDDRQGKYADDIRAQRTKMFNDAVEAMKKPR